MKKLIMLPLIVGVFIVAGCRHLEMSNFQNGETIKLVTHSLSHKAWVTMADGEVLEGKFTTDPNESVSYGFGSATAFGSAGSASAFGSSMGVAQGSHGTFYVLLKSTKPDSHLMMEIWGVYNPLSASGHGEARTNDGRTYKIVF